MYRRYTLIVICTVCLCSFSAVAPGAPSGLLRGDLNKDGAVDAIDVVHMLHFSYHDGAAPDPIWIADGNCDGRFNLIDVAKLISFVYRGGPNLCDAGFALKFDGHNDLVEIPFDVAYNTESFTLEAWIKIEETQVDYLSSIIDRWTFDMPGQVWAMWVSTGDFYALRGGYDGVAGDGELTGGSISPNQWHHLAYTRETGGMERLFIDGQLVGEQKFGIGGHFSEIPIRIGHSNGGPLRAFYGYIDEVRVWNIARSATEINSAKNTFLTGSEPGLIGYWDFNEGSGDVASDLSSTAKPGQLGHETGPDDSDPEWVISSAPVN